MNFYPYSSPIILTDDIHNSYGGDISLGSVAQRQAAYWMAEEKASEDIGSFLLPTMVTGTYHFQYRLILDHAYVNTIYTTRFIDFKDNIYYTISGTANIYVGLSNDERGLMDLQYAVANCACHSNALPAPYKIQVVYQAGLPSGTSFRPDVLLALSTYATIIMNEIIGYGNEAPGDVGVTEFQNQEYREKRRIMNTVFGNSPKAVFAHKTLTRLRKYRYVGL